jgi:hypothetical protein
MTRTFQYSLLNLCVAVIVGGALLLGCLSIHRRMRETPQALRITLDAVHYFLRAKDGKWPRSWDELAAQELGISTDRFEWPRDVDKISELVILDFDIDMAELAGQSPEEFRAIHAEWFLVASDSQKVARLLEEIRGLDALRKERERKAPSVMKDLWTKAILGDLALETVSVEYQSSSTRFPVTWEDSITKCRLRGDGLLYIECWVNGQKVKEMRHIDQDRVRTVFHLVWDLELWEQRTPARQADADEGRCSVRLQVGEDETGVWEWYNDMLLRNRILRVRKELSRSYSPSHPQ